LLPLAWLPYTLKIFEIQVFFRLVLQTNMCTF
jgi:hypothetical protein